LFSSCDSKNNLKGLKKAETMTNQRLSSESQPTSGDLLKVAIRDKESQLCNRLREVIGEESVASFSRRCSIGDSTLRKYLDGAAPSAINLVAIADAGNVNIEWLAAGRGPKLRGASAHIPMIPQAVAPPASTFHIEDIERVEMTIESIEQGLGPRYAAMPVKKRAQLFAAVYDLLLDMDQKENVVKFIKLAA